MAQQSKSRTPKPSATAATKQSTAEQPKIYKGLKISVVEIKRMKEHPPRDPLFRAKPGYELVIVVVKYEVQPEAKDEEINISRFELYDVEGNKQDSTLDNISFRSSPEKERKVFHFDFVCSAPEGTRVKTFKLIFGKAEPFTEFSFDLEGLEAKGKK
jgi:hypothetical protein